LQFLRGDSSVIRERQHIRESDYPQWVQQRLQRVIANSKGAAASVTGTDALSTPEARSE
jgi:hypothetical protein